MALLKSVATYPLNLVWLWFQSPCFTLCHCLQCEKLWLGAYQSKKISPTLEILLFTLKHILFPFCYKHRRSENLLLCRACHFNSSSVEFLIWGSPAHGKSFWGCWAQRRKASHPFDVPANQLQLQGALPWTVKYKDWIKYHLFLRAGWNCAPCREKLQKGDTDLCFQQHPFN